MSQMKNKTKQNKKQDRILEKELRKRKKENMDACILPGTEFKILVIRKLNELRGRIDELSENLHKEIETIKKEHITWNQQIR